MLASRRSRAARLKLEIGTAAWCYTALVSYRQEVLMSRQAKTFVTPEEYLALERQAEHKSEYYDGEIFAMTGASRKHNLITTNILGSLWQQLKGKPCEVYPSDMRVRVPSANLYTYPDVVVVCGEPQFEDEHVDT